MHRSGDESGLTLVELLVVSVILGVVGAVTLTGIVGGMQNSTHAQSRVDALSATTTTIERASREMRAADPLREIQPDRLALDIIREERRVHYRYRLEPDGEEWVLMEDRWTFDPDPLEPGWEPTEAAADTTSSRVLVHRIVHEPVFTAFDASGEELDPADPNARDDARSLLIRVRRTVDADREPIEVETTVTLRN